MADDKFQKGAKDLGKISSKISNQSEKIAGRIEKGTKKQKKFLKKPKGKKVTGISSTKTLVSFAKGTDQLVREVPQAEVVQDNRSQFFKRELEKEQKWLG